MNRNEIKELHYITHIDNMPLIWKHGILCHKLAYRLKHISVSMEEVQKKRANKKVPGGKPLHEYANFYFCARNPMLFYLKNKYPDELCILRISHKVLELPGVIITDRNASSDWVIFYSPDKLSELDSDLIFSQYWTHPEDPFLEMKHKSIKCAEVLIPDRLTTEFISGAYVPDIETKNKFDKEDLPVSSEINPYIFFR